MAREYTDGEIRQYIREVVREAKSTANVDTGYLKRSIRGDLIGRNRSVEFREIFYGAYNENSKLLEIAQRIMPNDINWKIVYENEEGDETTIKGRTRTGRTIRRSSIGSNVTGIITPYKEISKLLRTYNALVCFDAAASPDFRKSTTNTHNKL